LDDGLASLPLIIALLALHAVIVLSRAALVNARHGHLRELSETGNLRARHALELSQDPIRLKITAQFTLTLLRFAIAALATVHLAEPLLNAFNAQSLNPTLGYAMVLLLVALFTFLVADLLPLAFGEARADRLAPMAGEVMRLLETGLKPVVVGLSRLIGALIDTWSDGEQGQVTEEEIMSLVDVGQKDGVIEDEEKEMISAVLEFGETLAREVMVPRLDIAALDIETPLAEALNEFVQSGHSRLPVYEETIDNIKGLLYAKDLLNVWRGGGSTQGQIKPLLRPVYFVPETKRADMLFKELQNRKVHLAVVVDEYGSTAGIVTIEDLIEEIVGDIQDEYDFDEEAEFVQLGPDEYRVDGGINLDDFNDLLDVELPMEENDTLGGYILSALGRVAEVGEVVEDDRLHMRVESVEGRRIRNVHVMRKSPPAEKTESETSQADNHATNEVHGEARPSMQS
jgi:magnesium and cobalt exporter, CNNM family